MRTIHKVLNLALVLTSITGIAAPSVQVAVVGSGGLCETAKANAVAALAVTDASYTDLQLQSMSFATTAAAAAACAALGYGGGAPSFPAVDVDYPGFGPRGSDALIPEAPGCGLSLADGLVYTTLSVEAVCYDPAAIVEPE